MVHYLFLQSTITVDCIFMCAVYSRRHEKVKVQYHTTSTTWQYFQQYCANCATVLSYQLCGTVQCAITFLVQYTYTRCISSFVIAA